MDYAQPASIVEYRRTGSGAIGCRLPSRFGKEEGDYKRPDNRRMQEILNNVPGWERVASRKRISGYKVSMDGCYYRAIHNDDTNIEDLL